MPCVRAGGAEARLRDGVDAEPLGESAWDMACLATGLSRAAMPTKKPIAAKHIDTCGRSGQSGVGMGNGCAGAMQWQGGQARGAGHTFLWQF